MSPIKIKNGKFIYHQTALNNLISIVKMGLLSRAIIIQQNLPFNDVADPLIIHERNMNGLDHYVPFHFHPRTAFDYKIRYDHPHDSFVFLCMYRDVAQKCNALILPAHPLSDEHPKLYSFDEGIDVIDWDTMDLTHVDFGYNSQIRMAECLIKDKVDIRDICAIYVKNSQEQDYVYQLLTEYNIRHIKVYIGETFFGAP